MPQLRAELRAKGYPDDDEHCVIHAMFPQELDKLFAAKKPPVAAPAAAAPVVVTSRQNNEPTAAATRPAAVSAPAAVFPMVPGVNGSREFMLTINGQQVSVRVDEVA